MTSTELLDLFRSEMSDAEEPFLWSDADVYAYIDDAQKMFCRKTDGIADANTAAVCDVAVLVGTTWVDLHPRILTIRAVARADTGAPVEVLNHEDLATRSLRLDTKTGKVARLVIGMQENRARLLPIANEAVTLNLLVYRLPLVDIGEDGDQDFEIAAEHHPHLLMWAKARAYGKQDAETFDRTKKREFEAEFLVYCNDVKREQGRKRHKPRSVAYGGL